MLNCIKKHFNVLLSLACTVSALPLSAQNLSGYTSLEAATNVRRTSKIRVTALVCSCVSMTASLIAFYWFCRMQKRFRHRLIMLLIYGDLVRASWFFIAAVLTEVRGTVRTESAFCQSSGFLIQYGTETNDLAVLVIAVHSALQVFRPSNQTSSDGLYPYRRYVYAGAFLIPGVMASLAFIQPNWGYLSQGAFCTLPIRPFWYRLALAWIPRYCIVLTIIGLTAAIYVYVGWEFKKYNRASQHIEDSAMEDIAGNHIGTSTMRTETPLSTNEYIPGEGFVTRPPIVTQQDYLGQHGWHAPSVSQDHILSRPRRTSSVSFGCAVPCSASSSASMRAPSISTTTHSLTGSTRNAHLDRSETFWPPLVAIPSGHIVQTIESTDNVQLPLSLQTTNSILVTTNTNTSTTPAPSVIHRAHSNQTLSTFPGPSYPEFSPMTRRRARMYRQLRLMFIYPIVYTLMWLLPFVNHCMMYSDYYAAYPILGLRLAGTICIASMGFVNCLVFSLREKPWRAIPTSDGTLLGSFLVWNAKNERRSSMFGGGLTSSRVNVLPQGEMAHHSSSDARIIMSGGSLRTSASFGGFSGLTADQARERLEREREERCEILSAGTATTRGGTTPGESWSELYSTEDEDEGEQRRDYMREETIEGVAERAYRDDETNGERRRGRGLNS